MNTNDGYAYRHVVDRIPQRQSLLNYLAVRYPHSSLEQWAAAIRAGELSINSTVANSDSSVRRGDIVVWNRPGWTEEATPQGYSVVYCDDSILAVDKPSGLPTIPGGGFFHNTLLHLVQKDFPDARPLHRLGRGTSGLVLFALAPETASVLSKAWPYIHKQYRALSVGVASLDSYDIQCPIGKSNHPRLGLVHSASQSGKAARSVARTLQRRNVETVFEVDLHTGRPHQIRIHLAFIGHPLVGDPLFASGGQPRSDQPGLPGDTGYWLHAGRLRLEHPTTRREIEIIAPPPEILLIH